MIIHEEEVVEIEGEAEQVDEDAVVVEDKVAVEVAESFDTAIEMIPTSMRETNDEGTDTTDDDEGEDECNECGFPVNKSKPEDHPYCKVKGEDTAVGLSQ